LDLIVISGFPAGGGCRETEWGMVLERVGGGDVFIGVSGVGWPSCLFSSGE
jgi:hypothetical protein